MARNIIKKMRPYMITERKKAKPKPESRHSRLALYGKLIDKKVTMYGLSLIDGNRELSLSILTDIFRITTRMQREENQ